MSAISSDSISLSELLNFIKHHIYVSPATPSHELFSEPRPQPWRNAAINIIALLNLKEVAARLSGAGDLIKTVNVQLEAEINGAAGFPNPDDPGTSPHGGTTGIGGVVWHWHGPIPPGPLAVILALNQYSKTVADEKFVTAIYEVTTAIAAKANAGAARI